MIAIAYFHYVTLRSDINIFEEKEDARKWLFEKVGWLLDNDVNPSSLEELVNALSNESVIIEIKIINK